MIDPSLEPDERLNLPFDQYQRYAVTAAILEGLGVPPGSRILEVGGGPGPLESFLPEYRLIISDVEGKHEGGHFLQADGTRLPFADGRFPVVLALDVLEHVPAAKRDEFLAEARRVAGDIVIISAPFASAEVNFAEETLNDFIRARLKVRFPTLDEHRENGLPDLDSTVASFESAGWVAPTLPSGYLPRWLFAMVAHHELLQSATPGLDALHRYYNRMVSPSDCAEPAYRHVVVASHSRPQAEIATVLDGLRSDRGEDPDPNVSAVLASIASATLTQRLDEGGAYHQLEMERAAANDLRIQLADRSAQLAERDHQLAQLQAEYSAMHTEWMAVRERMTALDRSRYFGFAHLARKMRSRLAKQGETQT